MTHKKPPTREQVERIRQRHKDTVEDWILFGVDPECVDADRGDLLRRIDHLEAGLAAYQGWDTDRIKTWELADRRIEKGQPCVTI